jgi:hypothetical protein
VINAEPKYYVINIEVKEKCKPTTKYWHIW